MDVIFFMHNFREILHRRVLEHVDYTNELFLMILYSFRKKIFPFFVTLQKLLTHGDPD